MRSCLAYRTVGARSSAGGRAQLGRSLADRPELKGGCGREVLGAGGVNTKREGVNSGDDGEVCWMFRV